MRLAGQRSAPPLNCGVMRARTIVMRLVGSLYILLGAANLIALIALPELREEIISLGAVLFRHSTQVLVGIGMVLLRKWSAYALCVTLVVNWVIFLTVYSGQSGSGYPWYLSLIGPVLLIALYYYTWPVLRPRSALLPQERRA
jgi:hypothetical protein